MRCEDVLGCIDELLDNALDSSTTAELEAHLEACTRCRDEVESARSLRLEAASLPREVEPEHDMWPAIARRLTPRAHPATAHRHWAAVLGAAAAVVITTAVVTGYLATGSRPAVPGPGKVSADTVRGTAETRALIADGVGLLDRSITRLLTALARDPGNDSLRLTLEATRRQQLELAQLAYKID